MRLTNKMIEEIKDDASYMFKNDTYNSRHTDSFLARCYVKATLNFLIKNKMIGDDELNEELTLTYNSVFEE